MSAQSTQPISTQVHEPKAEPQSQPSEGFLVQYPLFPGRTVFLAEPAPWHGTPISTRRPAAGAAIAAPSVPSVGLSIAAAAGGLAVVAYLWSMILL